MSGEDPHLVCKVSRNGPLSLHESDTKCLLIMDKEYISLSKNRMELCQSSWGSCACLLYASQKFLRLILFDQYRVRVLPDQKRSGPSYSGIHPK